jgi:hypothetical protein
MHDRKKITLPYGAFVSLGTDCVLVVDDGEGSSISLSLYEDSLEKVAHLFQTIAALKSIPNED